MNELALFSGAGGGILGGKLLGWRTICAVERDEYAASVLVARQNDGILEPFPIWSDVCTFDGKPWRGRVDVISGGFPCQDISSAGKGAGITGERSRLWSEMARIVREVRPRHVFVENSPMLTSRGLGVVLGDLATLGYNARWGVLGAHHAGAPHKRDRIWILAYTEVSDDETGKGADWNRQGPQKQLRGGCGCANDEQRRSAQCFATDASSRRHRPQEKAIRAGGQAAIDGSWWETEPAVGRVADGMAYRVDRLRALGNGQVPAVAALAWQVLSEGLI